MVTRLLDGSAGDANYGVIGTSYAAYRQPDPDIAAQVLAALGSAETVLNVGAGAGSYEPTDRVVTAVEPSESMRRQRPAHLTPAVDAVAERLPFADRSFDAAMATFTIHQWPDLAAGLREVRRVTHGPIVLLSCDPLRVQDFWLNFYARDVLATEARRYPSIPAIERGIGEVVEVRPVPIPLFCRDGFNEAYYGRPERLLDKGARTACSAWSFIPEPVADLYVERLETEIVDGRWDERFGEHRHLRTYNGSLRLFICNG